MVDNFNNLENQQSFRQDKQTANFELKKGQELWHEGKLVEAIACYRRAIALKPNLAKAHSQLAAALKQQGKLAEASVHYRQAIDLNLLEDKERLPTQQTQEISLSPKKLKLSTDNHDSEIVQIYLQQAQSFIKQERWTEAINACQESLEFNPPRAEAYKIWGDVLQKMGKSTEAMGCYAKALTIKPDFAEVYVNLGGLSLQEQEWHSAINYYQKAIAINPNLAVAYRNLARVYKQTGQQEQMLDCWYHALKLEPKSATAEEHLNLARILLSNHKIEQAIACYEEAISLQPDSVDICLELGEVLSKLQRYERAISVYRHSLKLNPNHTDIYHNLGNVLFFQEKWSEAILCYQQVINRKSDCEESYYKLGEAALKLEKWSQAAKVFTHAIKINTNNSWSYHHLGIALSELERWTEASTVLQRSIELNPDFPWSYYHLGDALSQQEEWEQAIIAYRHFLKLEPNVYGYEKLGNALVKQARLIKPQNKSLLSEAWQCYRHAIKLNPDYLPSYYKAIELKPNDPDLYFLLAQAYTKQEEWASAIIFYQIGLQIKPNYPQAYWQLGRILEQQNQQEGAIEIYQKAIELQSQAPVWVYRSLGIMLQQQERLEEAIQVYQQAIELEPNQPAWIYENLGDIYNQQQKLDKAIATYEKVIAINPHISSQIHLKIGNILYQQGQFAEAKAAYEQEKIARIKQNLKEVLTFLHQYPSQNSKTINLDLLDNGCETTGRQLYLLAEQIKGRVVGINICPGFPEATIQHRRENTEFYRMDGQNLTFDDHTFDVVISLNVLEHAANPAQYLTECYRVIRPGGFAYFSWHPIWSGAVGHHVHMDMISRSAHRLGIKPPTKYSLDGKIIPLWGHLLLTSEEMLSLLIEDKKYHPLLAEWIVDYIYQNKDLNRWFWQDFLSAFRQLSWELIEVNPHKQNIPQKILEQLQQKYEEINDFHISSATIIVHKNK